MICMKNIKIYWINSKKKNDKVRLILCDTFHGKLEDKFKPIYEKWNEKIYEYAGNYNHKILKITTILKRKMIENKIEPNKKGGEKIVKHILDGKY